MTDDQKKLAIKCVATSLPCSLPLTIILICRAVTYAAGLEWGGNISEFITFMSIGIGLPVGFALAIATFTTGIFND